jgi:4-amino-4-deoxy-L-arabinose transferase-like glycosyltransferase
LVVFRGKAPMPIRARTGTGAHHARNMDMSRTVTRAAAALAALTVVRLFVAALIPLSPDEAYYWIWSRALAAGYLDHPPMVALWIRAGTAIAGSNPLGVRLFGPFSAVLGSLLLHDAADRLFPGRNAGLIAAALLNATLALGVGAVIMTPDTPLLLFWTATLWAAARLASGGLPAWWIAAGMFTGLALLSKYTAVFLPLGLALYILIVNLAWLRRREPWLGGLVAAVLFSPVVIWNARHEWVGFLRQGDRVADWRPERALQYLAELVGGQLGLATPGVAVLFVAGLLIAIRMSARSRDPAWSLLAALSVPPGLVFLQHALGDRVQGNWPAILYPAAAVAASGLTDLVWRRLIWPSCGLGIAIAAVVYAHVVSGWPALGARDPVARQLFGWEDLARQAEAARQAAGADFIAAEPYGLAAELAWTLPPDIEIVGAGKHWVPFALPRVETSQMQGILIRPERYGDAPDPRDWHDATRFSEFTRSSSGGELERYAVFRVRIDGPFSGAVLPHR